MAATPEPATPERMNTEPMNAEPTIAAPPCTTLRLDVDRVAGAPVLTVTVDRPAARNALSRLVLTELRDVFTWVAGPAATELRGVVLTGAGGRAFVAGADIAEMASMSHADAIEFGRLGQQVTLLVEAAPLPVVAAVDGYALGGGCELVLACDYAYCTERAVLGQPEVSLGLIPGFGGTVRLQRAVGPAAARELIYTGRRLGAADALALGLVRAVLPDRDAMLAAVRASLADVVTRSPVAVALAKRALTATRGVPVDAALEVELAAFGEAFRAADMREGTSAFLAKRAPCFPGR